MASSTTKCLGVRMKNEDIELLDKIVELGGFENRGDALRAFCRPAFEMCKTAIETKSVIQAGKVRLQEEKKLMKYLNRMAEHSEEKIDMIGDLIQMEPKLA